MSVTKLFSFAVLLLAFTGLSSARTVTVDVDAVRDTSAGCLKSPMPSAPANAAKMKVKSKTIILNLKPHFALSPAQMVHARD